MAEQNDGRPKVILPGGKVAEIQNDVKIEPSTEPVIKHEDTLANPEDKHEDPIENPIENPEDKPIVENPNSEDKPVDAPPANPEESVEDTIVINGETYTLDEQGNAVKDGEIVWSFEDIENAAKENDDILKKASELSGIQVIDKEGNPLDFDLTPEHIAERDVAIKELGKVEGWQEGFNIFMQENPDIANIINYKQRYGTIEGYDKFEDFSLLKIDSNNQEQQEAILYKAEIRRGKSPEQVKKYIDFIKADGSLESEAASALEYLNKSQTEEQKAIRDAQEKERREAYEADVRFMGIDIQNDKIIPVNAPNSVYDTVVNKGIVGDLMIPKDGITIQGPKGPKKLSRQDLFAYLAIPVANEDGVPITRAMQDLRDIADDPVKYARHCLLNLVGHDAFIKTKIESDKVKQIRELSIKKKPTGSSIIEKDRFQEKKVKLVGGTYSIKTPKK